MPCTAADASLEVLFRDPEVQHALHHTIEVPVILRKITVYCRRLLPRKCHRCQVQEPCQLTSILDQTVSVHAIHVERLSKKPWSDVAVMVKLQPIFLQAA